MEFAKRDASDLGATAGVEPANVNALMTSDRKHLSRNRYDDAHYSTECPHIRKTCSYCKKLGHIARVRESKDAGSNRCTSNRELKKKYTNKQVSIHAG
ncbi:hypothetical protein MRX96_039683 [Rhipicephalus microplus]